MASGIVFVTIPYCTIYYLLHQEFLTVYAYFFLLLSPQTIPYSHSFQLFLSATFSSSYQLLLSAARNRKQLLPVTVSATPYCISYFYKPVISATFFRNCHQVPLYILLPATCINHSFQVLLYLFYSHTPIRYFIQNSFVTNHYQLQYYILLGSCRLQRFFKIDVPKTFAILTGKHLC